MVMFDKKNKHLAKDHHYKVQSEDIQVDIEEVTEEDPIVENVNPSSPQLTLTDSPSFSALDVLTGSLKQEIVEELPSLELKNGWKSMDSAPHNGLPAIVSEFGDDEGIVAFWKRSRAFLAKRWQESGYWCDNGTGLKVNFTPQYWKERF